MRALSKGDFPYKDTNRPISCQSIIGGFDGVDVIVASSLADARSNSSSQALLPSG
jgi:hypothetical protein